MKGVYTRTVSFLLVTIALVAVARGVQYYPVLLVNAGLDQVYYMVATIMPYVIVIGVGLLHGLAMSYVLTHKWSILAFTPTILLCFYEMHGSNTTGCPEHHNYELFSHSFGMLITFSMVYLALILMRKSRRHWAMPFLPATIMPAKRVGPPNCCDMCHVSRESQELVHFAETVICVDCKAEYVQRIKEGCFHESERTSRNAGLKAFESCPECGETIGKGSLLIMMHTPFRCSCGSKLRETGPYRIVRYSSLFATFVIFLAISGIANNTRWLIYWGAGQNTVHMSYLVLALTAVSCFPLVYTLIHSIARRLAKVKPEFEHVSES